MNVLEKICRVLSIDSVSKSVLWIIFFGPFKKVELSNYISAVYKPVSISDHLRIDSISVCFLILYYRGPISQEKNL